MTTTIKKGRKCDFQIEHNGIVYKVGNTTLCEAQKKIHQFVRKWIIKEWLLKYKNCETTASLLADGKEVGTAYACHQNRNVIVIIS